jgi:hypothetical protein
VDKLTPTETLNKFFVPMLAHANAYHAWTNELPKTIVINPDILVALAKTEGFYQRPELAAMVSAHSPIVRYFKLPMCVVMIREDWDEKFYHFE